MSNVQGNWLKIKDGLSGVVGIHAALLHTGQVLFYARPEEISHDPSINNGLPGSASNVTLSTIINLSNPDAFKPQVVQIEENPFCSGLTFLPDGRLFVAGGDKKYNPKFPYTPPATKSDGRYGLRTFTPGKVQTTNFGSWKQVGVMSDARWYPTCALLPDGRVFIVSGYLDDMVFENNQNPTYELYPPLPGGPQYLPVLADAWPHDAYPFVFVLPSGSIFLFVKNTAYKLKLEKDKFGREKCVVDAGAKLPLTDELAEEPAKQYPNSATAVLLPLLPEKAYTAEVLLVGGGGMDVHPHWGKVPGTTQETHDVNASARCFRMQVDPILKLQWQVTMMNYKRVMPDAVLLPDGTVLVVNGVSKGFAGGNPGTGPMRSDNAVLNADLFDPTINSWQSLASASIPRLYHSTALLLPDATVLIAGSDHQSRDPKLSYEFQLEIFEPPYLFTGITRPVIASVSKVIDYKGQCEVEIGELGDLLNVIIDDLRVALLRPGSVTHGNNTSQRHVGLNIVGRSSTHLVLETPPNENIAPPGYYMLFVLYRGVPSEARFIQLLKTNPIQPVGTLNKTPGMILWLRADIGVGKDEQDYVYQWSDSSGEGNDVFLKKNSSMGPPQEQIERPPRWVQNELNGQPVIRFSLAFNTLATPVAYGACLESGNQAFAPNSSPYSVFCVTHPWPQGVVLDPRAVGRTAGWGDIIGWGDYTVSSSNAFVGLRLGPCPSILNGSELPKVPGTASILNYWNTEWQYGHQNQKDPAKDPLISLSSAALLEMFFDGVYTGLRINGYEIKKDFAPTGGRQTGNGPLTVGLNSGLRFNAAPESAFKGVGAFFRGDIAEIIIYERNIQGGERYEIQEYLRNKYALW